MKEGRDPHKGLFSFLRTIVFQMDAAHGQCMELVRKTMAFNLPARKTGTGETSYALRTSW